MKVRKVRKRRREDGVHQLTEKRTVGKGRVVISEKCVSVNEQNGANYIYI